MKTIFILLTLLVLCATGRAELPLVQDTSYTLPGTVSAGWDIRYWTSDNSLGWVALVGDSIRYVAQAGEPVQTFVIPDSVFASIEHDWQPHHERVYLCETSETGDDPCVVVQSYVTYGDYEYVETHVIHGWDLVTQELLFLVYFEGGRFQDNGGMYYTTSSQLSSVVLLPPPPAASQYVMIGQRLETHGYTMGDNNWGRIECVTRLLDCATDTMVIMDSSHVIMPFRGGDTLRVALAGHHSEWYNEDHWWINWIKTYAVGLGASAPLFQFGLRVAQSDADGMRRLILGSSALDANDYTELWHNDVMAEPTAAFRPCAGCDEILLSYHNQLHAFFVYDAATGLLIDNTSGIEGGSPRYVLPVPGRADALVTFVDSTRTARIYRLGAPPAPNRLTCLKVPGSEMLRLLWEPVPLVDRYCVFAAEESEGEGSLIADVPASQHSIEISPDQDRQFFTVRAIRD